jgi:hypothetical protein
MFVVIFNSPMELGCQRCGPSFALIEISDFPDAKYMETI